MPFLRAGIKPPEVHIIPDIPPFPEVISGITPVNNVPLPEDGQGEIFPQEHDTNEAKHESNRRNKTKLGREYERYVGKLYEKEGYIVIYNGIERGSWDGGIDLICKSKKGSYTVLVKCKNSEKRSVSIRDIYCFYGASRHYAVKHPREIVQSAFWTTWKIPQTSEVFKATIELGIRLYENAKRTLNVQTK